MEHDDRELITRVIKGDQRSFRELVQRYQQRVYAIAFGVVRNEEDALDITQEAFIKVHRHLPSFQGSSSFYTWLYRIVVNLCIDQVRRSGRSALVDFDDGVDHGPAARDAEGRYQAIRIDDPARHLGRQELRGEIQRALDGLSQKHREVIMLREIEGLSYKEIAEVLDISVGTVMSRLHHARQNLQSALRRYLGRE